MCDRIEFSDPAHSQFWHNSQPNEEQTEKLQKVKNFSKKTDVWKNDHLKDHKTKQNNNYKKCCIRLMRSATIEKKIQDVQQSYTTTTTTTNISYIQYFMSFLKKLNQNC